MFIQLMFLVGKSREMFCRSSLDITSETLERFKYLILVVMTGLTRQNAFIGLIAP